MQLLLVVVGIALLVFGAAVLLFFPDRPGGQLAVRGMTISSAGAGLPVLVIGVVVVVLAALPGDDNINARSTPTPKPMTTTDAPAPVESSGTLTTTPPETPSESSSPGAGACLEEYFDSLDVRIQFHEDWFVGTSEPLLITTMAFQLYSEDAIVGGVALDMDIRVNPEVNVLDLVNAECEQVRYTVEGRTIRFGITDQNYELNYKVDFATITGTFREIS